MGISINRGLLAAITLCVASVASSAPPGDCFVVKQRKDAPTVSVGGTVVPYREVTLAAQLPGRVTYLAGIEGSAFEDGQPLVRLDDRELRAQLDALDAQIRSAHYQVYSAQAGFQREFWAPQSRDAPGGMEIPNLFSNLMPLDEFGGRSTGVERGVDLYTRQMQIDQAHSNLDRLYADRRAIQSKFRDAKSIAPFDGVILKKFIEEGDTVQPGQPLLLFGDVKYLQVEVDVPARLRPGLRLDQQLNAELDIAQRRIPVLVAQIFPMADPQRHTVKVKFDLPEGYGEPGMYAKVMIPEFSSGKRPTPVIPESAVRYNGSLPGVYVIDEKGERDLRMIRVGEKVDCVDERGYLTSPDCITVLSGLAVGDCIDPDPQGRTNGWTGSDDSGR